MVAGSITVDMATVRRRKREMVERQIAASYRDQDVTAINVLLTGGCANEVESTPTS